MTETDDISTGNPNLDEILVGGLTPGRLYLIEGQPGTGKTTLGIEFLREGVRRGEQTLYITLSESEAELRASAATHGWSLDKIEIFELFSSDGSVTPELQSTMFDPSEIELAETTREVLDVVEKLNPTRIVIDSLSEMRMLAQSSLRYRRQILALKQFFANRRSTVLLLDDKSVADHDLQLHSIAHGVLVLEGRAAKFGPERRQLRVLKFRGKDFQGGWHDYKIATGGLQIYPRYLTGRDCGDLPDGEVLSSGNQTLDDLLNGGMPYGTSTLLLGPAGAGKSSCALMYAVAATANGDRAVLFSFDETLTTIRKRALGLGMDLESLEANGSLEIVQINPGEITPGQFAYQVHQSISSVPTLGDEQRRRNPDGSERRITSVVIIDSLNGFMRSMPEERFLQTQVHDLLKYLSSRRIVTFLITAQHGLIGTGMKAPVDASYLADTVLLFRYFEFAGEIRQAISVAKKRIGGHERTIHEFCMSDGVISVGQPLKNFQGVLSGIPIYRGESENLLNETD